MMTVKEVSRLTGVSVRTLQYYDSVGLLHPDSRTEAGYRLYDRAALERLQQILLFRELDFSLKEIKAILDAPGFDRTRALDDQIAMLRFKREQIEKQIAFAEQIRQTGGTEISMDFSAFDKKKQEEYASRAKERWGNTPAYREYEERSANRPAADGERYGREMMKIFTEFGDLRRNGGTPADNAAQALTKKLQDFITEHFYTCTDQILAGLGQMYAAGGEFTESIDRAGGAGTAAFAAEAIRIRCGR